MIVLDACVLIAYAEPEDVFHRRATDLLLDLAEQQFSTSALTMAEVLVGYRDARTVKVAFEGFQRLGVDVVDIPAAESMRLAELRQHTKLRMPDCCVLLAALQQPASGICTFDERLADAARRLNLLVYGVD